MRAVCQIAISVFLVCSSFSSVFSATYYISASGDDGADGSQSYPWRTFQHAADSVSAGDVVKAKSGTYAGWRAQSGGTSGLPITFKADDGASVTINAVSPDSRKGSIVEIEGYDWWVVEGFTIRDAPDHAGVDIRKADHVTARNFVCTYNETWGFFTGFAEYFTAEYNECSYSKQVAGEPCAPRATVDQSYSLSELRNSPIPPTNKTRMTIRSKADMD